MIFKSFNILVGGSGFIGSRLASLFSEEEFQIFDKNPSVAFPVRLTWEMSETLLALRQHLAGAGVVVLLAAEHRDDVVPTLCTTRSMWKEPEMWFR